MSDDNCDSGGGGYDSGGGCDYGGSYDTGGCYDSGGGNDYGGDYCSADGGDIVLEEVCNYGNDYDGGGGYEYGGDDVEVCEEVYVTQPSYTLSSGYQKSVDDEDKCNWNILYYIGVFVVTLIIIIMILSSVQNRRVT